MAHSDGVVARMQPDRILLARCNNEQHGEGAEFENEMKKSRRSLESERQRPVKRVQLQRKAGSIVAQFLHACSCQQAWTKGRHCEVIISSAWRWQTSSMFAKRKAKWSGGKVGEKRGKKVAEKWQKSWSKFVVCSQLEQMTNRLPDDCGRCSSLSPFRASSRA